MSESVTNAAGQPLAGKVALVTGASRGIGAAIAKTLMEHGATVIGTATSASGAERIDATLGPAGAGVVLDVTDAEQCEAVVGDITQRFGSPTLVVNNAGVTRDNLLLRMKDADIEDVLATNLVGAMRVSRLLLRGMMKARAGRIVNIGSVVGSSGNPGQVNYAASKAGLLGFTKSLAAEVGSRGITVNAVAPGFIDTDMTHALDDATRKRLLETIPLGRLGAPEDIAAVVAFLCGPGGDYVTGQTVHVNGGMYMG